MRFCAIHKNKLENGQAHQLTSYWEKYMLFIINNSIALINITTLINNFIILVIFIIVNIVYVI